MIQWLINGFKSNFLGMTFCVIVLSIFIFGYPIRWYLLTKADAKIIQSQEDSTGYHCWSNSVYCKYDWKMTRPNIKPHDDVVIYLYGCLPKSQKEKIYAIFLSYYLFIPFENRDRILADSNVIDYHITKQKKEISLYHEEGEIKFNGCELCFCTKNDTGVVLQPCNDIIKADYKFVNLTSEASYVQIHTYFEITQEQLFRLFNDEIVRLKNPLQIEGIKKSLNIRINHKKMKKLYERYVLIDEELDRIQGENNYASY